MRAYENSTPAALRWQHGLTLYHGVDVGGVIAAEEDRGRRYFYVRVSFPNGVWWPRTTETSSVEEAYAWIEEQELQWHQKVEASK